MAWECLDDPLILAACAGAGSAALSCARRLSRRGQISYRPLLGGSVTSYFVGGAISLMLNHGLPDRPTLVLAITILASWLWDWTTDESRAEWRAVAIERAKAIVAAALKDKDKDQ